jgi:hypothetical protein
MPLAGSAAAAQAMKKQQNAHDATAGASVDASMTAHTMTIWRILNTIRTARDSVIAKIDQSRSILRSRPTQQASHATVPRCQPNRTSALAPANRNINEAFSEPYFI